MIDNVFLQINIFVTNGMNQIKRKFIINETAQKGDNRSIIISWGASNC